MGFFYTCYRLVRAYMCTYTCTSLYVHMYASTCTHQAHVQAHVRMHKPIRTHVRTHKPIRTHVRTHKPIRICTHAQASSKFAYIFFKLVLNASMYLFQCKWMTYEVVCTSSWMVLKVFSMAVHILGKMAVVCACSGVGIKVRPGPSTFCCAY